MEGLGGLCFLCFQQIPFYLLRLDWFSNGLFKAHYPAEYMAAVLSNNMSDIKQVTFFMEECRRMGLKVLGPDVNESFHKFTVNNNQAIRFWDGRNKKELGKVL